MGLRLLLESICNASDAKATTLSKKIDELHTKALIDADEKELFHKIRTYGNKGAHAGEAMSADQVASGVDICVDLLDKLFIQPARKKKLMQKAKKQLSQETDDKD